MGRWFLGAAIWMAATSVSRPPPDRVQVPAGPFAQGSTRGEEDERPLRKVTLKGFAIDRTEVTRAAYTRCVDAGRCRAPSIAEADGNLPVTGVDWSDAQTYCKFAGGRLPTEAEWEKAARGTDGREYPWGNDADCARANWGTFEGEGPCAGKNPGRPVAVGSYPGGASPYGALDMGGNVWEWVADKYDGESALTELRSAERSPRGRVPEPSQGSGRIDRRVVRGGSCCSFFVGPRAPNRNAWAPDHRDADLGFRCAGAAR